MSFAGQVFSGPDLSESDSFFASVSQHGCRIRFWLAFQVKPEANRVRGPGPLRRPPSLWIRQEIRHLRDVGRKLNQAGSDPDPFRCKGEPEPLRFCFHKLRFGLNLGWLVGLVGLGLVGFGWICLGLVGFGWVWFGLVLFG